MAASNWVCLGQVQRTMTVRLFLPWALLVGMGLLMISRRPCREPML